MDSSVLVHDLEVLVGSLLEPEHSLSHLFPHYFVLLHHKVHNRPLLLVLVLLVEIEVLDYNLFVEIEVLLAQRGLFEVEAVEEV